MDTSAELQVWEKLVLGITSSICRAGRPRTLCDILKIGTERKGVRVARHRRRLEHRWHDYRHAARSDGAGVTQLDWPNVSVRWRGEGQQGARAGRQDSLHRRRASQRTVLKRITMI